MAGQRPGHAGFAELHGGLQGRCLHGGQAGTGSQFMSQFFQIHPENPQKRLINQAVEILRKGGVIVYPTDSGYALGCHLGDKQAADTIKRIRKLDDKHNFTLVCRDLSDIGVYAKVDNTQYRLLKTFTPGPYTFIRSEEEHTSELQSRPHLVCRLLLAKKKDRPRPLLSR